MNAELDRLPGPILVVGGYGYGNVGDEAILSGLLAKLGPRPVTVVSRDPAETTRLHGVPAIPHAAAVAALRHHRAVVIGGGGLFGRDMGRVGRLLPLFGLMAVALGRAVGVGGVDVDPRLALSARVPVPALMRRAAHVTVRDRRSIAILEGWNVQATVAPDLSCSMPEASVGVGAELLRSAGVDPDRPVIGLALTGVRPELADAALTAVSGAMNALPEAQFCFMPMSRHPTVAAHDDLRLAQRLQDAQPRLAIVTAAAHPADVLSAFGQLSAVVSMRYHGMLFAERAGVPLVPLVYAEKNVRWLDELGIEAVPAASEPLTAALRAALAGDERANRRRRVAS
jgi:polysaccharide pyruvyl transferase WcaK-like protein